MPTYSDDRQYSQEPPPQSMPFGGEWRWDGYAWQPVVSEQPPKSRKGLLVAAAVVLALLIIGGVLIGWRLS